MNEKEVSKKSVFVFLVGCLLLGIISLLFKDISYLLGFILGYMINLISFFLTIKISDGILKFKMPIFMVILMSFLKIVIYAIGFYISIKVQWIHMIGVFLGYLVIKITVYVQGYIYKGGELNDK